MINFKGVDSFLRVFSFILGKFIDLKMQSTKRGSVCIYHRNPLPLKILGFPYLQECINKLCRFVSLYRLPSQSQDDFEAFVNNFELNLDVVAANNTFLTVVLGDF